MAAKSNGHTVTLESYVVAAIKVLRERNKADNSGKVSKGIHTVYSGFNEAFRKHFGLSKDEAIEAMNKLEARGIIEGHFAHGGRMIYLKGEMPASSRSRNVDEIDAAISKAA